MNPHTWFRRIAPALRRNRNTNVGRAQLATPRDNLRAALAEFISTFIFVFAVSASATAVSKLTVDAPTALITAAVVRAFAFFAAVSAAVNISGGHVNPAVTFGALLGGNITLLRAALYFLAQLLGSIIACLLLKFTTGLQVFGLSGGVRVGNAVVLEMVMTFGLVHTVYATSVDPKRGNMGPIAPIAIGFIVGVNVLVGGAFDGASMNPALSLGPALLNWSWSNHWVYWVGPLIGGGLAGYVYELVFINKIKQPRNDYDYDYDYDYYGYYYS